MNKIIFVQMQHVMLCGTLYATNSSSFEFGRDKSAWWHLELRSGHNRAVVRGGAEGALAPLSRNLDVQKREQKKNCQSISISPPLPGFENITTALQWQIHALCSIVNSYSEIISFEKKLGIHDVIVHLTINLLVAKRCLEYFLLFALLFLDKNLKGENR